MSTKYGQFCPVAKAMEILGERWTLLIVRELLLGNTRFSDLQRALSQISPSLLTKRLNELVDHELVIKRRLTEQRRTEYHLTASGKELMPIVVSMGEWGMRWARGRMDDDELDVELLMFDLQRRLDDSALPGGRNVLHFAFNGLKNFANWWIVVDCGEKKLCIDSPKGEVDLTLVTDVRTLTEIWAGDTNVSDAKRDGRLLLKGSSILQRSISSWLRGSIFSGIRPAEPAT